MNFGQPPPLAMTNSSRLPNLEATTRRRQQLPSIRKSGDVWWGFWWAMVATPLTTVKPCILYLNLRLVNGFHTNLCKWVQISLFHFIKMSSSLFLEEDVLLWYGSWGYSNLRKTTSNVYPFTLVGNSYFAACFPSSNVSTFWARPPPVDHNRWLITWLVDLGWASSQPSIPGTTQLLSQMRSCQGNGT